MCTRFGRNKMPMPPSLYRAIITAAVATEGKTRPSISIKQWPARLPVNSSLALNDNDDYSDDDDDADGRRGRRQQQ